MGETAEILARDFQISREEQDAYARQSHARAIKASDDLNQEVCPIFPGTGSRKLVERDNGMRTPDQLKKLGRLRPVFDPETGTVTAGNASQITDGAVALLVASKDAAQRLGLPVLGYLRDWQYSGCAPDRMGLGPVYAMNELTDRIGISIDEIDLFEINEAFASQMLAVLKASESAEFARKNLHRSQPLGAIPMEKLNLNGGAIALGHPVGATGSRLVLTALQQLKQRGHECAITSACIGGGQGAALYLERNLKS